MAETNKRKIKAWWYRTIRYRKRVFKLSFATNEFRLFDVLSDGNPNYNILCVGKDKYIRWPKNKKS